MGEGTMPHTVIVYLSDTPLNRPQADFGVETRLFIGRRNMTGSRDGQAACTCQRDSSRVTSKAVQDACQE